MKLVAILGMHRSGTSSIAGLMHSLGHCAGNALLPPDRYNEKGYFESKAVVEANEEILGKLGHTWDDVRELCWDHQTPDIIDAFVSRITMAMARDYFGLTSAVVKDPRICRLLPLWKRTFARLGITPHYLIIVRQPEDVVASLFHRNAMTVQHSALLYLAHLLDAELHTRGQLRHMVNYSELIADPKAVMSQIERVFGFDFRLSDPNVQQQIDSFIQTELCHAAAASEHVEAQAPEAIRLARELYEELIHPDGEVNQQKVDRIMREYQSYLARLEPWLSEAATGKQLRREILIPGQAAREVANLYAHAALFWRTEQADYCEEHKLVHPVTFEGGTCHLNFRLPALDSPITGLRLDPVDRPAFCSIQEVALDCPGRSDVWNADLDAPLFSETSGELVVLPWKSKAAPSVEFFSTGKDPYGTLLIPSDLLQLISPDWVLRIEIEVMLPQEGIERLCQQVKHGI